MLGYRDSGMPDSEAERPPRLVPPGRPRRGDRPARRGHPPHAAAGHHHLRRRPAGLPASRPPAGARHLGAGVRTRRRPGLVSRARRAVPAVEAVLLDVVAGAGMLAIHEALIAARRRVAVRREAGSSAPTTTTGSPPGSTVGEFQWARTDALLRATPPRSIPTRGVLVRAQPTTSWPRSTRGRTGSWPARSSVRSPRTTTERDLFAGDLSPVYERSDGADVSVQYRVVVGKKDESVDGPDDADIVITAPLDDVAAPTASTRRSSSCAASVKAAGHTGQLFDLLKSRRRAASRAQPARIASLSARVADQRRAPASAQQGSAGAGVVGDEREVVDPLVRRRGQRAHLGGVDRRLHVDLGDARLEVGDGGVGTRSRLPARQSWSKWSGNTTPSSAASLRNGKPASSAVIVDGSRIGSAELDGQLEVDVEELGPQRDRREVRGEVGDVDAPGERPLDLGPQLAVAPRRGRRAPTDRRGRAGSRPRPTAATGRA